MVVPVVMSKKRRLLEFGRDLRNRRRALKLTLEDLAERAELTPGYIGAIENGHRDPSLSTIRKLALGLRIPTGALLGSMREVSQEAFEFAAVFDRALPSIQEGLLLIMRAAAKARKKEAALKNGARNEAVE